MTGLFETDVLACNQQKHLLQAKSET